MRPVVPYVTAALLFGLGVFGVLRRRNAVLVLMAVELMLNAVNLVLVTADTTVRAQLPHAGQVFALFVIVLAAAEIGVGLAIVLQLYRLRASVAVDEVPLTEPPVLVSAATATRGTVAGEPASGGTVGGADGPEVRR
ncbi:NADH-quinone oxidoreductase subunit NuoK [Micromonospora sp. R77]|uniref:NADH-quinone oxidoreductase subunit NuoK n=1 Tax=Micromonospora sp. R77 TaxID=2925836 RepID=UPI001F6090B1|nr:NADH-quinone oxidoreductase subunit NuoK [Micromonospora sp. R77]MCI4062817.1 NADH-quinone oxidoreductase subunit NuoK [Micromonospora sp. R77]